MRNIILSLLLSSFILADDHSIAVLDFSGENIHRDELKALSAVFRTELLQMDTLRVLDYSDMSDILIGYGSSLSCPSLECAVIASMLLNQEWLVDAHVSKIGDVFLIEARLIESSSGRVINAVSYDYDLTIEGLYTRGMHNLSEIVMSKRIPLEIHNRQDLVYFKTNPSDALIRVGADILNGKTPLAIDRVVVESRPIVVFKEDYEPFRVKQLPEDDSDIIYIELKLKTPKVGNVVFKEPIPIVKIELKDAGDARKVATITFEAEEVAEREKKVCKDFANQANIPGFRKGKVPPSVIRSRFGKQMNEELKRQVSTDAYEAVLKRDDLRVHSVLKVDAGEVDSGNAATVEVTVDIEADFELPDYESYQLSISKTEVSDEEVEKELTNLCEQRASYETVSYTHLTLPTNREV